jgi:site-specific recombinase XerD
MQSFALALHVDRAERTIATYIDAAAWFAGWLATNRPNVDDWADVGVEDVRLFFAWLREQGYAKGYRNSVGRALQAFFKWYALEEAAPNPFDRVKPPSAPKHDENPPPVVAVEQLAALMKDAERGRDFESRRDAALLRLFASTGCRLSEIALLALTDINLPSREATVTGKGSRQRTVRFDHKAALALDRYLRARSKHRHAYLPALWLGVRRKQGMTPSGVRQIIERRGERLGLNLHPHLFRHTFAHNWLDAGGAEGDLMALAGWDSPQMLRRYGASARAARARRAYDRVDVMRGA